MINVDKKIELVRTLMRAKNLDGILLRKQRSFSWLTGGKTNSIARTTELGVADLLIFEAKVYCLTTKMEWLRIQEEELSGFGFEWVVTEWYEGIEKGIAKLCGNQRIGTDVCPEKLSLKAGINLSRELAELTYVLDSEEIGRYRWLARHVAQALEGTCRILEPGMPEFEIQALLASAVLKLGITPQVLLVATDERIFRYRHPIPTSKKLAQYAMLVLCGEKGGLVANATRLVHFGSLAAHLQENRLKLAQIDLAFNLATQPDVLIQDVFRRGLEEYRKMGFKEDWRLLHQGGPTGYASREFLASPECSGTVQLHQAFAWNPSLRGIKSEDTILVTEKGPEFLTSTGDWDYLYLTVKGQTYKRPDILIR